MTVYTTGRVAMLCKVAPRTVSQWFDSGKLKGYRDAGSRGDRRIFRSDLIRFAVGERLPRILHEMQLTDAEIAALEPEVVTQLRDLYGEDKPRRVCAVPAACSRPTSADTAAGEHTKQGNDTA